MLQRAEGTRVETVGGIDVLRQQYANLLGANNLKSSLILYTSHFLTAEANSSSGASEYFSDVLWPRWCNGKFESTFLALYTNAS